MYNLTKGALDVSLSIAYCHCVVFEIKKFVVSGNHKWCRYKKTGASNIGKLNDYTKRIIFDKF